MTIPPPYVVPPAGSSSLSGSNFNQTVRINQVYDQLVNMLQVLQNVGVVQAQRLNLFSSWQKAYTDLMAQVPVFISSSSLFGGTTQAEASVRDDVNRVNASYLEKLRAKNSILGDDAKAMQSNISQTNDMVTQFGNMATSFLQELNTILTTIYR